MKKVVYTCISGQYDILTDPVFITKEFKVILTEEKYNGASTYERLLLQNKKGTY